MKYFKSSYTRWKAALALFLTVLASQALLFLPQASAVSLNQTMVRLDRLAKSATTTGLICAEPSVAGDTEGKLLVTFPSGFTVGASWTTSTASTTGWPSGAIAWPTIGATGTGSAQTVTFTSGDLTSSSQVYCFNWTNAALTNNSTTGSYAITVATQTSGGGALESSTATTDIVDTNCGSGSTPCDQINVTASVNQSFTFSLSANAAALGALSASSPVAATAINASVSTNAQAGWQMWGSDPGGANIGLRSTIANHTITYNPSAGGAVATLSNGVEGYNLGAGTASGTTCTSVTTDAKFASGGTSFRGGGLDGTLRSLAASTGVADSCALPLTVNASISNTTPAATDYAGTITVVAAGLF